MGISIEIERLVLLIIRRWLVLAVEYHAIVELSVNDLHYI